MNPRTTSSFYARESANAHRELAAARAEAQRLHSLLAETDARLREAWATGRLPAGVIPDDLVERTRAALAGEPAPPMTTDEIVRQAVEMFAARAPAATQPTRQEL